MEYRLPFGIAIDNPAPGAATVVSSGLARELGGSAGGNAAAEAVERLLVALASAGLDLSDPKFAEAVTTTVEGLGNTLD